MNFSALIAIVGLVMSAMILFDEKTRNKYDWAVPFAVVGIVIFGFIFIGWMFIDA